MKQRIRLLLFLAIVLASFGDYRIVMDRLLHQAVVPIRLPAGPGSGIPEDYYNQKCTIPYLAWGGDVGTWLAEFHFAEGYEYQANKWDCSEMSAYMEWALENCGYETSIMTIPGHAWIKIRLDEIRTIQFDPAFGGLANVWVLIVSRMYGETEYETIFDLYTIYGNFYREWNWWDGPEGI